MGSDPNLEEAGRRAAELYEAGIRQKVEPKHLGEYLVLNLETGDYVIGREWLEASEEADRKFPTALRYLLRIGYPAAVRIGSRAVG